MAGAAALALLAGTARGLRTEPVGDRHASAIDSARDELRVGRYWHAARILRATGIDRRDPILTLLLARAEAGWHDWPAVRESLEGVDWLDGAEGGEGWWLLGLAREDGGDWEGAARAYRSFLAVVGGQDGRRVSALARLARVEANARRTAEALAALDALPVTAGVVRSWMAVELADRAGELGDTAAVVALLARVGDAGAGDSAWDLLPRARLAAADSAGAEEAYRAVAVAGVPPHRAEAMVEAGSLTLARGDTAAAASLFEEALGDAPPSSVVRAAAGLVRIGGSDLDTTLRLASVLDRGGDGASALTAYDRAARLAAASGTRLGDGPRLARARLMSTVGSRRAEAIEEFRAIRADTKDDRIGARNLEVWAGVRKQQGRTGDVATLRKWLLAEYPGSAEAAEVRWERGNEAENRGDSRVALTEYAALIRAAPTLGRAGEARMRSGQIALGQGDLPGAARVFEAYLEEFPTGRRWDEAAYWAARVRYQLGDAAAARALVTRIRREEPVSYYAVMGARLLGDPYDVDLPAGEIPVEPYWLSAGLERLDDLTDAGLDQGADAEALRLEARARGVPAVQLRLAEALNDRGRTIAGINIGWALRREGRPWDRRLLQVVYPFPYRELVAREAAEWGLDPILLAALIRQESAFKADIRSGAGAVGLMQVMPPTGRQLARTWGPEDFHENSLTTPEVNLHLGAAFFVDMNRRYGGDLPLVLSAYNAGPTRATRWKRYPEASDPERFVERIPFAETKGYVKNVQRNLGLYQALYGPQ